MEPNTSQGSMATYTRCGGILNNHFAANLLENLPVEEFWKSVKMWQNCDREFGVQFFGPPCIYWVVMVFHYRVYHFVYSLRAARRICIQKQSRHRI